MIENYRGHQRVNMIEVCEGDGTSMSPKRIVRYFTDNEGNELGRVDPVRPEIIGNIHKTNDDE